MLTFADAQKLHAALHDAFRRVAVAVADAVGERSVVHTDAYGGVVLLANVEEWHKALVDFLQFLRILLIGIFVLDELPCRVYVVARIYANLFGDARRHVGHVGVEVDVGA